jgi:hypothetical protein
MNESGPRVDEETMKFGLLMESAQAHQRLAETHLEKLRAHTRDLDGVVRDEIRRTLVDELKSLTAESDCAARALRDMKRAANMRGLMWNMGIAVLCTAIPSLVARYALPSVSDIDALRRQRDALALDIERLQQRGGKLDWRSCGQPPRLCVRVDPDARVYGENADYYVVKER